MKPALLKVAYDIGCPAVGFALVIGAIWILRAYLGDEAPFAPIGLALTGIAIIVAGALVAWRTRQHNEIKQLLKRG